MSDVYLRVREKKDGDRANLVIMREGAEVNVEVKFFPMPGKKPPHK
jgi:hypothetical protein